MRRYSFVPLTLACVWACSSPTAEDPVASITVLSGDGQTAFAGTAVSVNPTVKVATAGGKPAAGVTVAFAVTAGGGTVGASSVVTNANGVAASQLWRLGDVPGPNTLSVSAQSIAPVTITATGIAQFLAVAAGSDHTCALMGDGSAACWGSNAYGQLGDGTTTSRSLPTTVSGGVHFTQIVTGSSHTCGLTSAGAAYCWGYNNQGQLGTGTLPVTSTPTPSAVLGGLTFTSISAGGSHTCGLTSSGAAYCWGYNGQGGLGDSTRTTSRTPVAVYGSLPLSSISAGGNAFTCARTTAGAAYCWGFNAVGNLGDGTTTTPRLIPTAVSGGLTFAGPIATGEGGGCGIAAGTVYCWGHNAWGEVGDGTTTDRPDPTAVGAYKSVAAGWAHACALNAANAAYCWGTNAYGEIGNGQAGDSPVLTSPPVAVAGGIAFTALTGGGSHTCGLTATGALYCWGRNLAGQLGDNSTTDRPVPTRVVLHP
jgi:alpha-tubulin suppressor-like RCC1 family protein